MSRLKAFLVAAGLAVGAVGCAHCDTCDDFPAPCTGPNCGGAYGSGHVAAPTTMLAPTAPATANDAPPAPPETIAKPADSSPPKPTPPGGSGL
jgi:hypothetical protein